MHDHTARSPPDVDHGHLCHTSSRFGRPPAGPARSGGTVAYNRRDLRLTGIRVSSRRHRMPGTRLQVPVDTDHRCRQGQAVERAQARGVAPRGHRPSCRHQQVARPVGVPSIPTTGMANRFPTGDPWIDESPVEDTPPSADGTAARPGHSSCSVTLAGGRVAERTNAHASKACEVKASGGSNPPPSARCDGSCRRNCRSPVPSREPGTCSSTGVPGVTEHPTAALSRPARPPARGRRRPPAAPRPPRHPGWARCGRATAASTSWRRPAAP